ncbi:unnamed protein product [Cercospora beticola]|nr:unnamed protein product [Cercospora beticola]
MCRRKRVFRRRIALPEGPVSAAPSSSLDSTRFQASSAARVVDQHDAPTTSGSRALSGGIHVDSIITLTSAGLGYCVLRIPDVFTQLPVVAHAPS